MTPRQLHLEILRNCGALLAVAGAMLVVAGYRINRKALAGLAADASARALGDASPRSTDDASLGDEDDTLDTEESHEPESV